MYRSDETQHGHRLSKYKKEKPDDACTNNYNQHVSKEKPYYLASGGSLEVRSSLSKGRKKEGGGGWVGEKKNTITGSSSQLQPPADNSQSWTEQDCEQLSAGCCLRHSAASAHRLTDCPRGKPEEEGPATGLVC